VEVKQFFANSLKPIIGIGGTVGKRTIAEMLRLMEVGDYVIMPLTARQLKGLDISPQVAIMNTVVPENPMEYGDFASYMADLENLTQWQRGQDLCFYDGKNDASWKIAAKSPTQEMAVPSEDGLHLKTTGDNVVTKKRNWLCDGENQLADVSDIRLLPHDWRNALLAIQTARALNVPLEQILNGLRNYKRLPERMQLVLEKNGEKYYNDAMSVTPYSGLAALESILGPKILILGGEEVGLDYTELAKATLQHEVKRVILMGSAAKRMEQALLIARFPNVMNLEVSTMQDVVGAAGIYAEAGDTVILSPSAPNNYGAEFNEVVGSAV
jgi:UDP-N-acetylmuramoylalanine--D-glutamate ligase